MDNVTHIWGVRPVVFAGCAVAAAVGVVWAVFAWSAPDRLVALALAGFALVASASLVTMRRRLTADRRGLVVRGPGGARRIPWTAVTGLEVVRRSRLGLGSTTLEVDLDDDGLIVLGRFDLGADPQAVAHTLRELWQGGRVSGA